MILHSKLFMVGIGRNIEHVFDPVGTVGNLEFVPIDAVILESAIPIETKSQKIDIETVLNSPVFYNETCMDQVCTDLFGRGYVSDFGLRSLHEGNGIALGIADLEGL